VDLVAAIRKLPPRQRDVVILRYLLDLDTATTATQLGIATGSVRAHLHHALTALRKHLAHDDDIEREGAHT
jgi:RNA polymerase sigma-70 factor (ECF subfamily)